MNYEAVRQVATRVEVSTTDIVETNGDERKEDLQTQVEGTLEIINRV